MATNAEIVAQDTDETDRDDKKLQDIFLEGWKDFENIDETSLPFNSTEFQEKVRQTMGLFETATRLVSQIGVFSSNELIDEVTTESLQYMLLPFFLGKLALKINQREKLEVLNIAEVYFKDYLQRCQEYELCDAPKKDTDGNTTTIENGNASEIAQLMRAAHARNDKIAAFRRKKELEEQIKLMKEAVRNACVDDEVKREFYLNFLKKSIIDAKEELDSINLEKQMVEMRKMHLSLNTSVDRVVDVNPHLMHEHSHDHYRPQQSKPKPLQPFIITRNTAQKSVFGAGYPSLPVMTVNEFYQQRVDEGIFPDEEKVANMNQAQVIAAAQDPNEKEDEEKAVVEEQEQNDDPEYIARMRRLDEYKDAVRRGDGNRYNRS